MTVEPNNRLKRLQRAVEAHVGAREHEHEKARRLAEAASDAERAGMSLSEIAEVISRSSREAVYGADQKS